MKPIGVSCTGHAAAKVVTNAGEFMLIHKASSTVLLGAGYTANLQMILEFMERERTNDHQQY